MIRQLLRTLHQLCLDLCRFVTRQECAQRREMAAETMRWAEAARQHREAAQRRLHASLDL